MNQILKIFLLLFLIANARSFGQTRVVDSATQVNTKTTIIKYRKFQLGVIAGPNLLQFISPPDKRLDFKNALGLDVGIHAQYNLKKNIAFTLNCLYETKSWKSYNMYGGSRNESTNSFHTLTLPLLFKYSPSNGKMHLACGPYVGLVMKKQVKGYGEANYQYNNVYEMGLALGVGFSIPIDNRISFTIEARDYINLKNSKTLGNYSRMNTTSLQVGFYFKFGETEQIEIKKAIDSVWQKEKKVFIKLFYSPQMTYRRKIDAKTTVCNFNYGDWWSYSTYDSNEEIPNYGNEYGFGFEFLLRKHFNINTGISLETQGFKTQKNITATTSGWGDFIGYWKDTTNDNFYNYKFNFVSVPLILNYVIKGKRQKSFYIGSGIELKFLYQSALNKSVNKGLKKDYGETTYNSRYSLFYIANIGMSFPMQEKGFLFIEPDFKFQLNQGTMPDHYLKYQLWSVGCKIGVKF